MSPAPPPLLEALGAACTALVEALARQSLYAAAVFVLALPAAALLRRAPGRVQAALWTLVLLRLLLPPGLAAPWSARSLLAEIPVGPGRTVMETPLAPLLGPPGARGVAASPGAPGSRAEAARGLLLALGWLAGVAITAARLGRRRRRYRGLLLRAAPVRDPEVLERMERFRRRIGVRRPVPLRAGGDGAPPFTLGTVRPVVHLPAAFLRPEHRPALDAALAHELAHVRASDDLRLRLRAVVQALFFFHPVAWWAAARHAEARELAADERVLRSRSLSSRAYGRGFAAAVRLGSRPPRPAGTLAAPGLGTDRRRLQMRLERILDPGTCGVRRHRATLLVLLAAGALVLPMAEAAPAAAPEPGPVSDPAGTSTPVSMAHPVPGARLTSAYGERWNPIEGRRGHHGGIDLAAPAGTPVLAPAAGVVRVATDRYGPAERFGTVVVLDHGGGLETLYAHLGSVSVAPGDRVEPGESVGTVGVTGETTGPHLHFEIRSRGRSLDPAGYLDLDAEGLRRATG